MLQGQLPLHLHLPALPETTLDRNRNVIDLTGDVWQLHAFEQRTGRLHWNGPTFQGVNGELKHCLRLYTARSISVNSPTESFNAPRAIALTLRKSGQVLSRLEELTEGFFRDLRARLRKDGAEWLLARVRSWYAWLTDQDIAGTCPRLARELRSWTIPGNPKGEAVMTNDPTRGNLDEDEVAMIVAAIGGGPPKDLGSIAVLLLLELGRNPKSLIQLEERDLHRFQNDPRGEPLYQIDVPRIKKRGQVHRDTQREPISSRLGRALEGLIARNQKRFGGPDPERPILHRGEARQSRVGGTMHGLRCHMNTSDFEMAVHRFAENNKLISSRTGALMELHPRRFRYTFAQSLVEQGASPVVVARLLDHSDLQNVIVYYKSSPKIAERVEKAAGSPAARVWGRFLGQVVPSDSPSSPEKAIYPGPPVLRDMARLGSCGAASLCGLSTPMACYSCVNFQAWQDAPHTEMLQELLSERERLDTLAGNNPNNRIPRQLDVTITAIKELVGRINRDQPDAAAPPGAAVTAPTPA